GSIGGSSAAGTSANGSADCFINGTTIDVLSIVSLAVREVNAATAFPACANDSRNGSAGASTRAIEPLPASGTGHHAQLTTASTAAAAANPPSAKTSRCDLRR